MTALCGLAQNFIQLLLARIGVGVGEAGCTPPAHSLIADMVEPAKRASALAFYALGIPIGTLLGMLIGGLLADTGGVAQRVPDRRPSGNRARRRRVHAAQGSAKDRNGACQRRTAGYRTDADGHGPQGDVQFARFRTAARSRLGRCIPCLWQDHLDHDLFPAHAWADPGRKRGSGSASSTAVPVSRARCWVDIWRIASVRPTVAMCSPHPRSAWW